MKNIKREKTPVEIYILENGKKKKVKFNNLLKRINADGLIKMSKKEYSNISTLNNSKKSVKYLTHFNLQRSGHKIGNTYFLVRIIEGGYYKKNGSTKLPFVDLDDCYIAKCIDVKENLSYSNLNKKEFSYSFSYIKNVPELKKDIVRKYSKSLPDYSKNELLNLGISFTKLELKGKHSNIKSSQVELKAIRDGFGEGLLELGKIKKNVVALTADLTTSTKCDKFANKYPNRFVQCGICEQNMMSAAAGMAVVGKIPFVNSFAVFNPGRNWDQLRVSVCYSNLNVKVHGSHAGLTVGQDGATHQALEDIAITRVLPNMTVIVPSDSNEAKNATISAGKHVGPVYIRTSRMTVPNISNANKEFKIGKANILSEGKNVTMIVCGIVLHEAIIAVEKLKSKGISVELINCPTIKPLDKNTILKSVKKTKRVVTVEEHQITGGLGSAIAELVTSEFPVRIERVGVKDTFGESGDPKLLLKKYGLDSNAIVRACMKVVKKK